MKLTRRLDDISVALGEAVAKAAQLGEVEGPLAERFLKEIARDMRMGRR